MADRYWVGGTGTWNTSSTTNWSATSGGAGGASVPTSADDVFFDQAGTYTVTMTGALNCRNFTVSAGTVTYATGTSPTLAVAGSMSLITGTVWNSTGTITFSSTGAKSITSAGTTFACSMTITGAGGTFTLNDNLTLSSTRTFTLTNGTVNLNAYTLSTGIFSSANSNTRAINFGDSKIVLTGNTTGTIWDFGTSTNCTTSGSQLVEITGGGGTAVTKTISAGITTSEANSVNFSILDGVGTNYTFTAGHNIKSLVIAPTSGGVVINNTGITIFGSFTNTDINGGTATFNAGAGALTFSATSGSRTITTDGAIFNQPFTINAPGATYSLSDSLTTGSTRAFTLTAGTLNLNGFTLSAGTFVSSNSNVRNINFNNGGQIVVTNNNTTVLDLTTTTNYTTTGTPYIRSTYAGATGTRTFVTGLTAAQVTGYDVSTSGTSGIVIGTSATDIVALTGNYNNIDFTGLTNTISNTARAVYGNFTVPSTGGTLSNGTATTTFSGVAGTTQIVTVNRTLNFPIQFGGTATTTYSLASDLSLGPASTSSVVHNIGILSLGSFILSAPVYSSSGASSARTIDFGTGKIVLNYNGAAGNLQVWQQNPYTGFSVIGNNPLVEFTGGGTGVTKTLATGGGFTEANSVNFSFLETTGTVTYAFSSNPAVRNLVINGSQTFAMGTSAFTIYGSLTHSTTNGTTTFTNTSGSFTFIATAGFNTITTPAVTYDWPWTFNGSGSTWQLQSNVTIGTTRTLTLTAGTLDLNNQVFTANIFSSSNSNQRSIDYGTSGQLALTGNNATIFDITNATNFNYTGTLYINSTYTGSVGTRTFSSGLGEITSTGYDISTSGTTGIVLSPTATDTVALTGGFGSVDLTGFTGTLSNTTRTIYGNFVIPATGGTYPAGDNLTTLAPPSSFPTSSTGYSVNFNGSTDFLTAPAGSLNFLHQGEVSWTFETWFNSTTASGSPRLTLLSTGIVSNQTGITIAVGEGSRTISVNICRGVSGTNSVSVSSTNVWSINTWNHLAVTFDVTSKLLTAYVNGVSVISTSLASFAFSTAPASAAPAIGRDQDPIPGRFFPGLMTNLRVVSGTVVYTSDFTPPSTPLTAITGTALLICQTTNFVDASSNNYSIGINGSPSISGSTPFASSTVTRILSTNGRALNFPITIGATTQSGVIQLASALTLSNTRTLTLTSGTLDLVSYTITTGLFSSSNSNTRTIAFGTGKIIINSATTSTVWNTSTVTGMTVTGTPLVECVGGGTATKSISCGALNEANSISFSLLETTGTVVYAFAANNTVRNLTVNGVQTVSNVAITIFGNFLHQTLNGTTTFTAGTNVWTFGSTSATVRTITPEGTYDFPWTFNGVGGSWQLQTNNLTLGSTRAFTLANGTFDFNNRTLIGPTSGITINGGTVTMVNTAGTLSTALPIIHTAGTLNLAQNLTTTATTGYTFTAGTLNLSSFTLTTLAFSSNNSNARTLNFGTGKIVLNPTTTGTIWTTATVTGLTVTGAPRVECIGGGSSVTKTISTGSLSEANAISFSILETSPFIAYTFTAGSTFRNLIINSNQSTFSNTAITVFGSLIYNSGNGGSAFTAGANAWTFANTGTTTTNGFYGAYAQNLGNGIGTVNASSNFEFTGDFTIEGWVYMGNSTYDVSPQAIVALVNTATSDQFALRWGYASGKQWEILRNTAVISDNLGGTLPNSQWTHIALVRSGSTISLYVNGVSTGTTVTDSSTLGYSTYPLGIGYNGIVGAGAANALQQSYISNLRIVKGIAVYTGDFTVPTGPLTATQSAGTNISAITGTETVLLTCQSSTLIDNSSYAATITSRTGSSISLWNPFNQNGTGVGRAISIGVTLDYPLTFNGVGGTWELDQNLTIGSTRAFTLSNGTFDFNTFAVSGPTSGVTINGGSTTISNTGGTGTLTTTLPFTHTAGTLTLTTNVTSTSNSGYTLTAGALVLGSNILTIPVFSSANSNTRSINFGTGKIVISAALTATVWNTSTTTGFSYTGTGLVEFAGSGGGGAFTQTINTGALTEAQSLNFSLLGTSGPTYTFTAGNVVRNLIVNGAQTISNIAISIFGSFTHLTTGGTTTFTAGVNAWTFAATSGTQTITTPAVTYDFPWTFNGVGGTWQLQNSITLGSTRAFTLTNGTFDFNNFALSGPTSGITVLTGSATITNTGGTFTTALPFTHTSGTLTLAVNVTTSSASGYTLTAGTLALNTFTLTTRVFSSSNANTRSISFGTGKIVINASTTSTVWNTGTTTGLTYTGTSLVEFIGGGSAVTKTINTGTLTEAQSMNFSFLDTGGTPTYTFTASNAVRNITFNGTQTISNITITIFGNFLHQTAGGTTTFTAGTNIWTFAATSGTRTITTPAVTYDFPWTFNGVGGTWQLQNNLSLGSTRIFTLSNGTFDFNNFGITQMSTQGITISTGTVTIVSTGSSTFTTSFAITHSSGTLNLGVNVTSTQASGYSLTAGTLNLNSYTLTLVNWLSSNANTRSINFGTGKIVMNPSVGGTFWNMATLTGFTISGTPLVECIGGGTAVTKTINTGTATEAQSISFSLLETTGTVTYTFTASNAVRNLIVNGVQTISNIAITIFGNFTHQTTNGTTTFTAGANIWTFGATSGSYTLGYIVGFTYDFPWRFGSAASTAVWTLSGNLTLGATRQLTLTSGTLDFNSQTVSAAGITINNSAGTVSIANTGSSDFTTALPFTHTAGTFTLPFNVTTTSTSGYAFNAGTLALSSFTLTSPAVLSNVTNNRTLNFGTGKIVLNGSTTATIWTFDNTTLTISGTPLVECIGGGTGVTKTISAGAMSEAQSVSFSLLETTGTVTYSMAGRIRNFIINGSQTITNTATVFIYGSFTHLTTNGTTNITASANSWTFDASSGTRNINNLAGFTYDFPWTFGFTGASTATYLLANNLTLGSTRALTLTAGTLDLSDLAITAATLSSNNSNTRQLRFGTTGQITLGGNAATIVDFTTMTGFTYTGTTRIYSSYSGATGTRTFNLGGTAGATATNIFNVSIGTSGTGIVINAGTDSIALTGGYNNIDLTGLTMTVTNTVTSIYGNLIVPASGGAFTAGANTWSFLSTSSQTINTGNRLLDFPITFNGVGGSWTLQSNYQSGTSRLLTLTAGTLNLNNFNFSAGTLSSTNSNRRTLAFGSTGQVILAGSTTTVIDMTIMTNFTETGTPYINSTGTGARSYIFGSSGGAFPDNVFNVSRTGTSGLVIGTGADSITLTGSFGDIDLTGFTGTLTNTARTVYGNVIIPATGTFTAGTAVTTIAAPITSPVASGYSIYLDGNLDYLTVPANAAFAFGTGDFTVECWINPVTGTNSRIATNRTVQASQAGTWSFSINATASTTTINLTEVATGEPGVSGTLNSSVAGTWAHVAACRSGTTTRLFINGAQVGSGTQTTNFSAVQLLYIGTSLNETYINGYISNLRILKGQALYTEPFTPSTNPLTTTSQGATAANVSLLTCQGPQINDASTNNFAVTVVGNTNMAQLSPFAGQTVTTRTVTTNGRTLDFPISLGDFLSGPGIVQLSDALTLGTTRTLTLNTNIFNLNNLTATSNAFASNNSANRTLSFGTTGQLTLVGSGATIWNSNIGTNFNANGTKTVFSSYAAGVGTRTIDFGNISESASFNLTWGSSAVSNNFTLSNAATDLIIIRGALNDWNQGSFNGSTANQLQNATRTIYGNTNISGGTAYQWFQGGANVTTFAPSGLRTINTNNMVPNIRMTMNGTGTLQLTGITRCDDLFTLTQGNIDLNGFFLGTWQFNSSGTSNRNIAFGTTGNSYIATGIANTVVINVSTATNFTWSGIAKINCGNNPSVTGTRTIALGNAAPFDPNFTLGIAFATVSTNADLVANSITIRNTSTDTITVLGQVRDFDLRTSNNTITNQAITAYGNFYTSGSGGTISAGTNTLTLAGYSGNYTVATAGRQLDFPITFNGNGNYEITQTLTVGTGTTSTRTLSLLTGNITPNGVQINCGQFNSNSGNIRSINFTGNPSRIIMWANNTTVWNSNNGANFSYTGNLDIESGFTGNTGTRTFDFGNIPEAFTFNVQVSTTGNAFSLNTANDTVNLVGSMNDLNLTSFTGTLTNASKTVFGNLTIPATGGTYTAGTTPLVLASTSGVKTINTANRALAFPITFNGVGGNWTLANGLNANTTTALTLANGTVDFNQRSLVFANITIAGGATGNASLSNLSTTLAFVHANGTLNILSGAINSSTSNAYTLNSGTLNVSANFSTGAFTNNGGNVIL